MVERKGSNSNHHRWKRRKFVNTTRTRRICFWLRYFIGFSGYWSNCYAQIKNCKVQGIYTWYKWISISYWWRWRFTSLKLDYKSSTDIISTGLPELDKLFSGKGIYRGGSTLITGTAGTAKTILAMHFAMGSCRRKEPVLYFSFWRISWPTYQKYGVDRYQS